VTLVAAIQVHTVPVLFGDLMLRGAAHAGTRRKLLRLRPTLAIGWADTHIVARAVLRELDQVLPHQPTLEAVRTALRQFSKENGRLGVQLTGWLLGDVPTAFMWDGNYPQEFVTDAPLMIGSGSEVLWKLLNDRPLDKPPPDGQSAVEYASFQTLTLTGNLMKSDLSDRILQQQYGFGVGYDILIADTGRFRYLSPIVYSALQVEVDAQGRIGATSRPWGIALLRSVGEFTVCQVGRNVEGMMDIDLVSPVLLSTSPASEARLKRALLRGPFVFDGLYCVLFTQLYEDGRLWPPLVGVVPRAAPIWLGSNERGITIAAGGPIQAAATVMAQRRHGRW
jgi:hypothetical protein